VDGGEQEGGGAAGAGAGDASERERVAAAADAAGDAAGADAGRVGGGEDGEVRADRCGVLQEVHPERASAELRIAGKSAGTGGGRERVHPRRTGGDREETDAHRGGHWMISFSI
jgi:hypothetical protein